MNNKPPPFSAIFASDDPLGLLAEKASGSGRASDDEIAIANFQAINAFIDQHGTLPGNTDGGREPSLNEYSLEAHLDAFRDGPAFHDLLAPYDRHALLSRQGVSASTPATMAELVASDDPLLHDAADRIFTLRHVEPSTSKAALDEVAKRRPCENFADFAPLFAVISADLAAGRRKTVPFEGEGSVKPGTAFIFHGLTAYVADVDAKERRGKNYNARTRVIFDNGTESNLLLRSFARALYDDTYPRQIVEVSPTATGPLFTGEADSGNEDDRHTGNIYVVESLSSDPGIAALRGRLFKIGFTTQPVEQRLANVEIDPTFLLAPVRVAKIFETVNLNPQKLERLIHQFFAHARFKVDILLGRAVSPREWFVVPLDVVKEAIDRILDGTVLKYRYDHISRKIVPRE